MRNLLDSLYSGVEAYLQLSKETTEPSILRVANSTQELCWGQVKIPISIIKHAVPYSARDLQVTTKSETYRFTLTNPPENWVNSLISYISDQKAHSKHPKSFLIDSLTEIINKYSQAPLGAPEDLPSLIEETMNDYNTQTWDLEQELEVKRQENNKKSLESKLNMLRKRVRMLDDEHQQGGTTSKLLSQVQTDITKEQQHAQYLTEKIQQVTSEKENLLAESKAHKEQLDSTLKDNASLHKAIQSLGVPSASTNDPHLDILIKGFHGYICTFVTNQELTDSMNLTPRRPYENGVYKKRLIRISPDLKYLIWHPISLFSSKKACVEYREISAVLDGTEDPKRLEPFTCNKYVTVLARGVNVIISVDKGFCCYLEAIKKRYQELHKGSVVKCSKTSSQVWQIGSDQLNAQAILLRKLTCRYKTSLIESICYVSLGREDKEKAYLREINVLKNLNEDLVESLMSPDAEDYLRMERASLLERKEVLQRFS